MTDNPLLKRLLSHTRPPTLERLGFLTGAAALLVLFIGMLSPLLRLLLARLWVVLLFVTVMSSVLTGYLVTRPEAESEQHRLLRLTFVDKRMLAEAYVKHALYRMRIPFALLIALAPAPLTTSMATALWTVGLAAAIGPLGVIGVEIGVGAALRHRGWGAVVGSMFGLSFVLAVVMFVVLPVTAIVQSFAFWAYSMLNIDELMPLSLIPAVLVIGVGAPLVYRVTFRTLLSDIVISLR